MSAATAPQQETWLPTQKAMAILDCSRKTLQIYASRYAGQIGVRREKGNTFYRQSDLVTFKERKSSGVPMDAEQVPGAPTQALQRVTNGMTSGELFQAQLRATEAQTAALRALVDHLTQKPLELQAPAEVKQEVKLFVSLNEAAKLSGLPGRWLLDEFKAGRLGRNVGVEGGKRHIVFGVQELNALSRGGIK